MNQNYTDVTIVLDRSGSMNSIKDATIEGLNTFINDQKKVTDKKVTMTLIQFDAPGYSVNEADPWYKKSYENADIRHIASLTPDTFQPRGSTALLDAMGQAITETGERLSKMPESQRPANVIFAVMTDGEENASKDYIRTKIFDMIKHQTDKYGWVFVFLGANQNAIAEAARFGFGSNNSMTYAANTTGTRKAFMSLSSNVGAIMASGCAMTYTNNRGGFFSSSDYDAQIAAGVSQSDNAVTFKS